MNILFLIGNGFDINVGLDTRYKDALKFYLLKQSNDSRIVKFKQDITPDLVNWSDFEKQMGVYTENFTSQNIDDYCFCMRDFRESLAGHLKNEESRADYTTNKDKIVSVFLKSIFRFYKNLSPASTSLFENFMKGQGIYNSFMTFNYTNVFSKCIGMLKSSTDTSLKENESITSFNVKDTIKPLLHIHGTTERDMVMGIDNVEQIKNVELRNSKQLERTIIKPIINKKRENLNNENGVNLIDSSNIICIFGLSLGETDKSWWEKIGLWLKYDHSRRLVIFGKGDELNPIHPEEAIESIDNVVEKFLLSANITQNQEQYTNRIHVGLNTDMFKIKLT